MIYANLIVTFIGGAALLSLLWAIHQSEGKRRYWIGGLAILATHFVSGWETRAHLDESGECPTVSPTENQAVELAGIEPAASCLRHRRSPN